MTPNRGIAMRRLRSANSDTMTCRAMSEINERIRNDIAIEIPHRSIAWSNGRVVWLC